MTSVSKFDQTFKVTERKRNRIFGANHEEVAAVTDKLVRSTETEAALRQEDNFVDVNSSTPFLHNSLNRSMERIRDSNNTLQLLPDIRLALEIIIGGILSPKDLMTVQLTYSSNNAAFEDGSEQLLTLVENHFTSSYKLKPLLPKMLEDILAKTGSYPLATIPETSIDHLINGNRAVTTASMEGLYNPTTGGVKHIGFIGNNNATITEVEGATERNAFDIVASMENLGKGTVEGAIPFNDVVVDPDFKLSITDNYDVLKLPELTRHASTQAQQRVIDERRRRLDRFGPPGEELTYSEEAMVRIDPEDRNRDVKDIKKISDLYKTRIYHSTPIQRVRAKDSLSKPTIGHPTVIKIPTEAVIPIFTPTEPESHIGYLVALDRTGHPIRIADMESIYASIRTTSNARTGQHSAGLAGALINKATTNFGYTGNGTTLEGFSMMEHYLPFYSRMVETDLIERLENGTVGAGVKLGNVTAIYQMMMARALAGKQTQLLYLPASLLSYLAVDFDEYGLGKTLLDDSKVIASLRSMQLFINSMASSKNAITRRTFNVELSEAEMNPQKAEEIILHEIAKSTQGEYPIGNNPVDQINYLQRAGVAVRFANHPRLPNTDVSVDYQNAQYQQVDTSFDDLLKKMHTMSFGLPVEVVEGAGSADFATQTIYANVMTSRRIKGLSEAFCHSLSGFVRRYTYNSQILMDDLTGMVKSNNWAFKNQFGETMTDEEVAREFINSLEVTLPLPDNTSLEEQLEAFGNYKALIDELIEIHFSTDFLSEADLGELGGSDNIDKTKNFARAYFLREWCRENGVAMEMFNLLAKDKHGKPVIDMLTIKGEYMDKLAASVFPAIVADMKRADLYNKKLEEQTQGLDAEGGGVTDPDTGGGDTGGGDGGDWGGGDDDFDTSGDDDLNAEPTDDPEEETGDGDDTDTGGDAGGDIEGL